MSQYSSLLGDIITTLIYASVIPGLLFILYLNEIILAQTLKVSLFTFFIVFFIGPLIFKLSYKLQQQVIFLNYAQWPRNPSYNSPEKYDLPGTRNFYIKSEDNVKLGVWHILPIGLVKDDMHEEYYNKSLKDGPPIILYMHGNSGNRAAGHRVELYKVLREKYQVIAFDYRSYGDSTNISPTESGCVKDAISMIQWVRNQTNAKIFVWGHSLGTGISIHALHILSLERIKIDGLILESPFNNMRSEVGEHPSSWLFKDLPWFKYTIVEALYNSGFQFESDTHILHVDCPILILHAEDDLVIPVKLGYKLYKVVSEKRTKHQGFVKFEKFSSEFGFGHKYICRAPQLENLIETFVDHALVRAVD